MFSKKTISDPLRDEMLKDFPDLKLSNNPDHEKIHAEFEERLAKDLRDPNNKTFRNLPLIRSFFAYFPHTTFSFEKKLEPNKELNPTESKERANTR